MSHSSPKSHGPTRRPERVGELIRRAIAEIFARGNIFDPDLARRSVTIPSVRMSPDLKFATVSVMPLSGDGAEETLAALNRHRKQLRALVAGRIKIKFAPELRFSLDPAFDAQARIDALLKSPAVARDLVQNQKENSGDA
jgi:ribosome-binding factor A